MGSHGVKKAVDQAGKTGARGPGVLARSAEPLDGMDAADGGGIKVAQPNVEARQRTRHAAGGTGEHGPVQSGDSIEPPGRWLYENGDSRGERDLMETG